MLDNVRLGQIELANDTSGNFRANGHPWHSAVLRLSWVNRLQSIGDLRLIIPSHKKKCSAPVYQEPRSMMVFYKSVAYISFFIEGFES